MATQPAPVVTAFDWVPDFAKGLVRDLRVRWAFEELGEPYASKIRRRQSAPGRLRQLAAVRAGPRVPRRRGPDFRNRRDPALHRREARRAAAEATKAKRWQAIAWLFAGLNSVEPSCGRYFAYSVFNAEQDWAEGAKESVTPLLRQKLKRVSDALGGQGLARRRVLDRRHHDGHRAQQPEGHRLRRRISVPRRLPCARHGAAGLPAGARRAAGRFRRPGAGGAGMSYASRWVRDSRARG